MYRAMTSGENCLFEFDGLEEALLTLSQRYADGLNLDVVLWNGTNSVAAVFCTTVGGLRVEQFEFTEARDIKAKVLSIERYPFAESD